MSYSAPKGTFDLLPHIIAPEEQWRLISRWQWLEGLIGELTHLYGYREVRTPIFEQTDLFVRSAGGSSDVVSKEMFTFLDRAGRSMSLRPEGTAAVMRALLEERLQNTPFNKFFYIEPMFRYDRPQAGRYRQHHQFGVEVVGSRSPCVEAEALDLLYRLLARIGLKEPVVCLNSLGDAAARTTYLEALKNYLKPHLASLSEDSRLRFEKNPLRILDSKDATDREILKGAPLILDFLSSASMKHLERLESLLGQAQIPYTRTPHLVRGLDYYTETVFEVVAGELGAQNSVLGGGRYDGLSRALGGPDLPAFGYGMGLERLLQMAEKAGTEFPAAPASLALLFPIGEENEATCFALAGEARSRGIAVELCLGKNKLAAGIETADLLKTRYIIFVGDKERTSEVAECREMATKRVFSLPFKELWDRLKENQ